MAEAKKKPTNKETVYIDVDDEITSIIEKVKSSDSKIVALVLPKRATVMQSVVNMRLLKKAAGNAKKSIVLITNETGLLPLAGAAGVHVAKSLQSKPEIPPAPKIPGDDPEEAEDGDLDKTATVGALAAAAGIKAASKDTETIELDNLDITDNSGGESTAEKAAKAKKKRHLKVPNFERFRLSIVLGILGAVLLFVGWLFAFVIMPKATIAITTDSTSTVSSFDFTASTKVTEVDIENDKIPAVSKSTKKSDSQKSKTTGEKDNGTKASGSVTLTVDCTTDSTTVATGTAVSNGDLRYITQEEAELDSITGGSPGNWECSETVDILAAENGDKYNLSSGQNFAVSGHSNVSGSNSSAFTGGTSKIVKIVSQKDVDDAVTKITETIGASAGDELKALFEAEELLPLDATLFEADPKITATPKVGGEAEEVTVKVEVEYSMLGVKEEDLQALIENDVKDEIDLEQQSISSYGIDNASMNINRQNDGSEAFISFRGTVTAGPEIDTEAIKAQSVGKKRGEIEQTVGAMPGVEEVVVEYSPFWVYSTPKAAKKITVTVENPEQTEQNSQDSNVTE